MPFVAVVIAALGLGAAQPRIDRIVERVTHHREVTPYSSLAAAAARIRAGSLEKALPGLAQVLADGTGATRAVVWLAVGRPAGRRGGVPAAARRRPGRHAWRTWRCCSPGRTPTTSSRCWTARCCARRWRSASPARPITPADQQLVQDVANGAALLLRGVALNAELRERVRRADDLAQELQASRQRLARAREVERRRLVMELGQRHDRPAGRPAHRRRGRRRRARPLARGRGVGAASAHAGPGRARRAARPVPPDRPRRLSGRAARPGTRPRPSTRWLRTCRARCGCPAASAADWARRSSRASTTSSRRPWASLPAAQATVSCSCTSTAPTPT